MLRELRDSLERARDSETDPLLASKSRTRPLAPQVDDLPTTCDSNFQAADLACSLANDRFGRRVCCLA
jgi:hypothetical protein